MMWCAHTLSFFLLFFWTPICTSSDSAPKTTRHSFMPQNYHNHHGYYGSFGLGYKKFSFVLPTGSLAHRSNLYGIELSLGYDTGIIRFENELSLYNTEEPLFIGPPDDDQQAANNREHFLLSSCLSMHADAFLSNRIRLSFGLGVDMCWIHTYSFIGPSAILGLTYFINDDLAFELRPRISYMSPEDSLKIGLAIRFIHQF